MQVGCSMGADVLSSPLNPRAMFIPVKAEEASQPTTIGVTCRRVTWRIFRLGLAIDTDRR